MKIEINTGDAFLRKDRRIYTVEKANSEIVSCYECQIIKGRDRDNWYLSRIGLTEFYKLPDFLANFKRLGE